MLPRFIKKRQTIKENYRPISLLHICCKILERLIYNKIFEFFTDNELISSNQSGFKPGAPALINCFVLLTIFSQKLSITFFLVFLVSWSLLICRIELLDTPIEYKNAVQISREEGSQENLQFKNSHKTVIALTCSKFEKYFRYDIFDLVMCTLILERISHFKRKQKTK